MSSKIKSIELQLKKDIQECIKPFLESLEVDDVSTFVIVWEGKDGTCKSSHRGTDSWLVYLLELKKLELLKCDGD